MSDDRPAPPCRRHVLVIDDDTLVRTSLGHLLRLDHEVTLCAAGADALQLLIDGTRFDAVLCDLNMPGMDGVALYDEMATAFPEQLRRTVFLTGGAYTTRTQEFLARVPNEQMEKPFDFDALRLVLARLMG